jgi:hypothetical protein
MPQRLIRSALVALALAMAFHVSLSAKKPAVLICQLEDGTEFGIVIENLGGMHEARRHCIEFWNGHVSRIER